MLTNNDYDIAFVQNITKVMPLDNFIKKYFKVIDL